MILRLSSIFTIAVIINIVIGNAFSSLQLSSELGEPIVSQENYNSEEDSEPEEVNVNIADSEESSNEALNATANVVNNTDLLNNLDEENLQCSELSNSSDIQNSANVTSSNATVNYLSCILNKTYSGLPVEIVNASRLVSILQVEPNITNRHVPGKCVAVFFYSPSCPFSCMAAPHFNALPRFFPDIKMVAVDAMTHRSFNAQYGIVGVPTLMLFHNGRPAARFNDTCDYALDFFSKFITRNTGLEPDGKLVVTSADFSGPISSVPIKETDYYLILSWVVIGSRLLYLFYHSSWGRWLVDATSNAWREAEAQHHHAD